MISAPTSLDAAVADRERLQKLLSFNFTDRGNAEAFDFLHGSNFRFDHSRGIWLHWNSRFWERDDIGEADRAAVDTARQRQKAALQIADPKQRQDAVSHGFRSESSYGRKAMLSSAETITRLATRATDYDRDLFLLTVGNGTLDLRSGVLRECRPEDMITRATSIPYSPEATCPRWEKFLEEVFIGDLELISFLRRAVGYSLTGDTREQCLVIAYGNGSAGKSTLLETLLALLGTHAAITSFATFLIHQHPGAPRNDIAKLHGARLVKASESQKEAALDEATVKEVTGGDSISARFLFKEYFEFRPQFKIWLATNHRPTIHGTDDAIWRRVRLIPFNQQFTGKQRDPKLRERLEAELSGILAWAVRGCLEWQRTGLGMARVVETATISYRKESDHYGRFLFECCTRHPRDEASGQELFDAYVQWCGRVKDPAESNVLPGR